MDISALKQAVKDSGHTVADLCTCLGIDASTYYRKLNLEGETFTVAQAKILAAVLNLSGEQATKIFFS